MGVARMVGHITYLSAPALDDKFGRRLQFADDVRYTLTELQAASPMTTTMLSESLTIFGDGMTWPPPGRCGPVQHCGRSGSRVTKLGTNYVVQMALVRLAFRMAGPRSGDWHDPIIGETKGVLCVHRARYDGRPRRPRDRAAIALRELRLPMWPGRQSDHWRNP